MIIKIKKKLELNKKNINITRVLRKCKNNFSEIA